MKENVHMSSFSYDHQERKNRRLPVYVNLCYQKKKYNSRVYDKIKEKCLIIFFSIEQEKQERDACNRIEQSKGNRPQQKTCRIVNSNNVVR